MKLFLKHTLSSIIFLAGLMALLLLFSEIMMPKDNTREAGIDEISMKGIFAEPENTIDVLFMGDSTTYCGIIPLEIWRDTGITSYVAGTPLQYLHYTNELLDRIYETQSPKYLFMDVNPLFYQQSPLWLSKYFPQKFLKIFRYHDNWKVLKLKNMFAPVHYTHIERDKGHIISHDIAPVSPEVLKDYGYASDESKRFPIGNQACFETLLKKCQDHGTKIILISIPSVWTWNMCKHNGAQKIAKHYGLEYLDLNLIMNPDNRIDWNTDTTDNGEHLNDYGAIKVSDFFAKYMLENLNLPDHRNDSRYQAWNTALIDYDTQIEADPA